LKVKNQSNLDTNQMMSENGSPRSFNFTGRSHTFNLRVEPVGSQISEEEEYKSEA
jgi:hypothetical protein